MLVFNTQLLFTAYHCQTSILFLRIYHATLNFIFIIDMIQLVVISLYTIYMMREYKCQREGIIPVNPYMYHLMLWQKVEYKTKRN